MTRAERIGAALAALRARRDTDTAELETLRTRAAAASQRIADIQGNVLYKVLPAWVRNLIEAIAEDVTK